MTEPKAPKATLPRAIVEALPSAAEAANAITECYNVVARLIIEVDEAEKTNDHVRLVRCFVAMHRLHEKIGELDSFFGVMYNRMKTELVPSALEAAGVTNVPLAEGYRIGVSYRTLASIKEGMRDKAFLWLRTNGLGDLITSTVNASTLSAAAKHCLEEDNKDLPDDLFNVVIQPNTSVTATKTK